METQVLQNQFVHTVNYFGIKCIKQEDSDYLISSFEKHYEVTVDFKGQECAKNELDWVHNSGKVNNSMNPFLNKALYEFDYVIPA